MAASAAGGEPQKQLLSRIRDFATENSHGERRVSDLMRRLDDVRSASDAAAAELEAAKRAREDAEQELSGSQVKASIAAASIQALEAIISHIQEEILKVGSDLDALKGKGDIQGCDSCEFVSQMDQLNTRIRRFQRMLSVELKGEKCSELTSEEGQDMGDKSEITESEGILEYLIDKVNNVDAEVHVSDEEYKKDLLGQDKVCKDCIPIQGNKAAVQFVHPLDLAGARFSEPTPTIGEVDEVDVPSGDNADLSTIRDLAGKKCHSKSFSFLPSTGDSESSDDSTASDDDEIMRELSLYPSGSDFPLAPLVSPVNRGQELHISDQFLSTLPPLPHFEIPQRKAHLHIDNDTSESDSDGSTISSSNASCIELDTLENEYAIGGPSWEAMVAPIEGLALEEEEEKLMMEGQIKLGNSKKANRLITLFDEAEKCLSQVTEILGQPILATGTFPTSRSFLLNLPLLFLCKEKKDAICSICKYSYDTKDRCVQLPCNHFFHMGCILQWLLSQNTCPICRYQLPSQ